MAPAPIVHPVPFGLSKIPAQILSPWSLSPLLRTLAPISVAPLAFGGTMNTACTHSLRGPDRTPWKLDIIGPFYRLRHWGPEWLSTLPKFFQGREDGRSVPNLPTLRKRRVGRVRQDHGRDLGSCRLPRAIWVWGPRTKRPPHIHNMAEPRGPQRWCLGLFCSSMRGGEDNAQSQGWQ